MSIVVFQHEPTEGPGLLAEVLRDHGHRLRVVRLFAGDAVPPDLANVHGVISMGGNANVGENARYPWLPEEIDFLKRAHAAGLPTMGVCLGAQLIAAALGGEVGPMDTPEVGWQPVKLTFPGTTDPVFAGIPWSSRQMHLHGQEVKKLAPGAVALASSPACPIQAFRAGARTYGFQYHFEWTVADIDSLAHDVLMQRAGMPALRLRQETRANYPTYRRLGRRLCQNLVWYVLTPGRVPSAPMPV